MPEVPQEQQAQQDGNPINADANQAQGGMPTSWDEYLNGQSENVKALYTQHVNGLRNTVQATRQERDELAKQIRDLSAKATKGSELETSLNDITQRLEAAERRAAFLEEATRPEIGCRNSKAAYALATAEGLFDRKGAPDWAAIKAAAPELFGTPQVRANAGAGTQEPPKQSNMNEYIRRMAGRS